MRPNKQNALCDELLFPMSSELPVNYCVSEIGCRAPISKGGEPSKRGSCPHVGEHHYVRADNPDEACQTVRMLAPPCTDCGLRVDIEGGVRVDRAPFPVPYSATIYAHAPTL